MTDELHEALSVLEINKRYCDLRVSCAITKLLDALEEADNVNVSKVERLQVEG